jgi:hypothetical protein
MELRPNFLERGLRVAIEPEAVEHIEQRDVGLELGEGFAPDLHDLIMLSSPACDRYRVSIDLIVTPIIANFPRSARSTSSRE